MEEQVVIAIIVLFLVVVIGFTMKYILSNNAYEVSWTRFGLADISNMMQLAKKTDNPIKKVLYYALPIGLPVLYGLAVILVLTFVFGISLIG